jgi:hypothetical protein
MYFFIFLLMFLTNSYGFSYQHFQLKTRFPNIPINHGIRHIHSIEHIATTHLLGAPQFKIISIQEPNPTIPSINFTCSIINLFHLDVMMMSRYTNRCEMVFTIFNKNLLTLQITVLPDLRDDKSHYFIMNVLPLINIGFFKSLLLIFFQISMFISAKEDMIRFFNKNNVIPIKQFNDYRKLIYNKF